MDLAVETLNAAIATETPVEAKSSGRKAKGKKGEKAASLGPSGEEVTWAPRVICPMRVESAISTTLYSHRRDCCVYVVGEGA